MDAFLPFPPQAVLRSLPLPRTRQLRREVSEMLFQSLGPQMDKGSIQARPA